MTSSVFPTLSSLTQLYLAQNALQQVPLNLLAGFTSLQTLDLSDNLITAVDTLGTLRGLVSVALDRNRLDSIPDDAFQVSRYRLVCRT